MAADPKNEGQSGGERLYMAIANDFDRLSREDRYWFAINVVKDTILHHAKRVGVGELSTTIAIYLFTQDMAQSVLELAEPLTNHALGRCGGCGHPEKPKPKAPDPGSN